MTKQLVASTGILGVFLAAGALAQNAPQMPQPGPEQKRLAYFAGRWTSEADMKASPMGPAGKMTSTDTCQWFAGGFHVICNSEGKSPMGTMKGMALIGYDDNEKKYTYYTVDNMGHAELAKGTVDGKTWNWTSEGKMEGKAVQSRYTITEVSPTSYTFKWDASVDGGASTTLMEGKATKAGSVKKTTSQ